ncbi:MAG: nucleoside 2-deoxyribosyltransferase domain-containing protein [Candidatus Aminicenantes bacterium]
MYKPKIYLSGGFSSNWQKKVIESLGDKFIYFNPRDHKLKAHRQYWTWDVHFLKVCDILFGYMEQSNPSGYGLALEVGLAYSLDKTIILVDERSPLDPNFKNYFTIVHSTANIVFSDLHEGIEYLLNFAIGLD